MPAYGYSSQDLRDWSASGNDPHHAPSMASTLRALYARGWRIVWCVHANEWALIDPRAHAEHHELLCGGCCYPANARAARLHPMLAYARPIAFGEAAR